MPYGIIELEVKIDKAKKAFSEKEYDRAMSILNDIIANNPDEAVAYRKIGDILMRTNNPQQAVPYLKKALELLPSDIENWKTLFHYYKIIEDKKNMIHCVSKILEIAPEEKDALFALYQSYHEKGNMQKSFSIIKDLYSRFPDDPHYVIEYATLLTEEGKKEDAISIYNNYIDNYHKEESFDTKILERYFNLMVALGHEKELQHYLKQMSSLNKENVFFLYFYGRACEVVLDYDKAFKTYIEAHVLEPENAIVNHNLGVLYGNRGDIEKSSCYYKKVLKIQPLMTNTIRSLGMYEKYTCTSPLFQHINYALTFVNDLPVSAKAHLHYAAGKAFEDIGDLKTAFEHYRRGGYYHAYRGKNLEDLSALEQILKGVSKLFDANDLSTYSEFGYRSSKPVFIVGMPRSGTTLLEQILCSFDGVEGVGESGYLSESINGLRFKGNLLNFTKQKKLLEDDSPSGYEKRGKLYVEKISTLISNKAQFIVDKMPDNFKFLGYLHLILPEAKIIHIVRHPVETCLSSYRILFEDGHYWADDLTTMGKYYHVYTQIMDFWKKILPENTLIEVHYEDLVTDPETQSKHLASFMGAEWHADCLDFHKKKSFVRTASLTQVRQPIYRTSMNRWRKYEPYLQPLLEEIGDLTANYETKMEKVINYDYTQDTI